MQNWPSTVGLAIVAAYWLVVILFIVLSLLLGILLIGRARVASSSRTIVGALLGGVAPAVCGAGAGAERHPGWALLLSGIAIAFSFWWLHNMAKREP